MKTSLMLTALVGLALSAGRGNAACETLTGLQLPHTAITVAQSVPSGKFAAPDGKSYDVPAFCRVHGLSKPTGDSEINFEVWMPAQQWNGRYYQHGQGGSGGAISFGSLAGFLASGAVGAATDDGHVTPADDGLSWALNHPQRIVDFGYRALKETADAARALSHAYYGRAPQHAYFEGCSDGGRLSLMAAQRFPEDWNGILAGAPGNYRIRFTAGLNAWLGQIWLKNPAGRIPPAKLPVIQRAALAACRPEAHVVDGIPTDPRQCRFDPAVLSCQGADQDNCLTQPQVSMLRTIYAGPRNRYTGEQIFPGFLPTTEDSWGPYVTGGGGGGQAVWASPDFPGVPAWLMRSRDFYRNFVFDNHQWDFMTLDLERDVAAAQNKLVAGQTLGSVLNSADPDLSRLRKKGAKMLMYSGWADSNIGAEAGIEYYDDVVHKMGGLKKTQGFYRLFLAPGMTHCLGGPGPNAFGQFPFTPSLRDDAKHNVNRALEAWVEKGIVPQEIVATKYVNDDPQQGVAMTRPLCPYPQLAVYNGTGSTKEATSFSCVEGAKPPAIASRAASPSTGDAYVATQDWRTYNGSLSNSHYSSLTQINRENVSQLEKAWEYRSGEGDMISGFQFNPLVIDGVMYVATAIGGLAALDPATGKQIWKSKPLGTVSDSRGTSYWQDPKNPAHGRLLFLSGSLISDGNTDLYAVDVHTGDVIRSFGANGHISLGVPVDSPGVIYRDLVILGSSGGKRGKGQVTAYDVRSGKLKWAFQTIPRRGQPGSETWGKFGPERASGANCWGGMAVDEERGVVYLATSQPKSEAKSGDFFSGDWQGRDRFASSVIALKADTGALIWDFQETRHDIWDFDIPAPPNLVRVNFQGHDIDAVAQVTKRGNTLLLSRDSGKLLYPAEERSAPPSHIPGERTYPSQWVFNTPEPFAKTVFAEEDITDLNPKAHDYILSRFRAARAGWFEPPSVEGTIYFGVFGGAEWGGAAFDPSSHMLYVNSNHVPWFIQMRKAEPLPAAVSTKVASAAVPARAEQLQQGGVYYKQYCATCHGAERQGQGPAPTLVYVSYKYTEADILKISISGRGVMPPVAASLPDDVRQAIAAYLWNAEGAQIRSESGYKPAYITTVDGMVVLRDEEGYPGSKRPWGTLNAINLDTGKIVWRVPLGEYPKLQAQGVPPTGTLNFGGGVITAGGLLFIGATADEKFRAFDRDTGRTLWESKLPFGGYATPATYAINGRQYVVIAASGGGNSATPRGDAYVAFALPEFKSSERTD